MKNKKMERVYFDGNADKGRRQDRQRDRNREQEKQSNSNMIKTVFKGGETLCKRKGMILKNKTTQNKIKYNIFTMYLQ